MQKLAIQEKAIFTPYSNGAKDVFKIIVTIRGCNSIPYEFSAREEKYDNGKTIEGKFYPGKIDIIVDGHLLDKEETKELKKTVAKTRNEIMTAMAHCVASMKQKNSKKPPRRGPRKS